MFKWLRITFVFLALSATAAYAALPGKHRALTPALFGITNIEGGLYTDAPERQHEFDALYAVALARTEAFFGPIQADPRIIICTMQACADTFDLKPRGLTLGAHLIFLGPKGVNEMILTHELAHIHIHSALGLQDVFKQRIPAWFNEGLATYLSADPRVHSFSQKGAKWITQAQSFRDWGRLHQNREWQDTYGAAKSLVAALHAELGDAGLRALIDQAIETGDFEQALADAIAPDWP